MEEQSGFSLEMLFPLRLRASLAAIPWKDGLEEVRVRVGQPLEFSYGGGRRYLAGEGGTCRMVREKELQGERVWAANGGTGREASGLYRAGSRDIAEMLNYISNYSLYAYREEVKQGFITIRGGHRIGICGGAVVEGGRLVGMHHITFLNIRVAHERVGCAGKLMDFIRKEGSIYNTLLVSAPGAGKTTYLRDSIRLLSKGDGETPGLFVCVVDERSEIAACHMGIPQNDLGPRTDVLDGCPKAEGMLLMIRSMSPQVLAVDELGTENDFAAADAAACSGSRILGTVHAGDMKELTEKPYLRRWIRKKVFERYVLIRREASGERRFEVYDDRLERVC